MAAATAEELSSSTSPHPITHRDTISRSEGWSAGPMAGITGAMPETLSQSVRWHPMHEMHRKEKGDAHGRMSVEVPMGTLQGSLN